jgi:protein translocase SecG subunit|tara:strand:+ start:82 stop:369 length:288 start_codon:yes stop_codon:yes gene_type:complete
VSFELKQACNLRLIPCPPLAGLTAMYLNIFQIIFGILLITAILMQSKGSGLGAAFGGGGNVYRTKKRGSEKFLFVATIIFAVLFFGLLMVDIFIV